MLALVGILPAICYAIGTFYFARFKLDEAEHARIVAELNARRGVA